MLNNVSKEIFYYSFLPAMVISFIIILLLIFGRKKSKNYYKFNYFIKVLLVALISIVLCLMIGYTIWVFIRLNELGTLSQNVMYMVLLFVLSFSLLLTLVTILLKLYKEKELQE